MELLNPYEEIFMTKEHITLYKKILEDMDNYQRPSDHLLGCKVYLGTTGNLITIDPSPSQIFKELSPNDN
jgi:hypothetical protein